MDSPLGSPLVRLAAARAADDSFFLGAALAAYGRALELDEAGLARRLGCAPAELPHLTLCRCPNPDDASFAADVRRIATWAAVDADELMNAVRYAAAIAALRRGADRARDRGTLLAARDYETPPGAGSDRSDQADATLPETPGTGADEEWAGRAGRAEGDDVA
jgi:hypothetical protein